MKKINVNAIVILIDAVVSATNKSEGFFPRDGNKIKRNTTAKSWNSKIPTTLRPCSVSNSARSEINLVTIAVDDIANAPPKAMAACHEMG